VIRTPPSQWPSVKDRSALPHAGGIYAVISESGEVLYIGRTCSIRYRVFGHNTIRGIEQPYRLAYFRVIAKHRRTDVIMSKIELALIKHYRPVLNRQSNPDYYARKAQARA
jgi:excinuclease UvrABC nuclease subunit